MQKETACNELEISSDRFLRDEGGLKVYGHRVHRFVFEDELGTRLYAGVCRQCQRVSELDHGNICRQFGLPCPNNQSFSW